MRKREVLFKCVVRCKPRNANIRTHRSDAHPREAHLPRVMPDESSCSRRKCTVPQRSDTILFDLGQGKKVSTQRIPEKRYGTGRRNPATDSTLQNSPARPTLCLKCGL